ncbi:hypothetical protein MTO96_026442 [Rhipicephalus appendiculatus]
MIGVCHLLNHLTDFNDVLWNVGLQLREVDAGKRLGDLVIATVQGACDDFTLCNSCAHNEELPVFYLHCLLRVHRCIVSAEMNCGVANSAVVIEALASSSLRRLTVRGTELEDEREALPQGPPQASVGFLASGYVYPDDSRATPVIPLLLQRDSDTALTSLNIADLSMTPSGVSLLIKTLMENETVTELAVGYDVFARQPEEPQEVSFEGYLTKKDVPLKKLALKSFVPFCCIGRLWSLAQTISSMTTLEELYVEWPTREALCAMFAAAVFQSRSLRCVSLQLRNIDDGTVDLTPLEDWLPRLRSWPFMLRQNSVLRNLDLDVSWCRAKHCRRLLKALAQNWGGLQTLYLRNLLDDGCLKAVCDTIRKGGDSVTGCASRTTRSTLETSQYFLSTPK